jgi:hypothetical protein
MSGQLKLATHSQQIYLAGGYGPVGIGTGVGPVSAGWIKLAFTKIDATSNIRIIFFRILFSFRVGGRRESTTVIFLSRASTAKSICNLPAAAGEQARGHLPRELASRSQSPIRPLSATSEPHFSAYFLSLDQAVVRALQLQVFIFGPVETSAGEKANARGGNPCTA